MEIHATLHVLCWKNGIQQGTEVASLHILHWERTTCVLFYVPQKDIEGQVFMLTAKTPHEWCLVVKCGKLNTVFRVFCRLRKVGWIFTQSSKERDYILSSEEVAQIAGIQEEMGETAVTAVVSLEMDDDENPDVHFEAFQVSLSWVFTTPPPSGFVCVHMSHTQREGKKERGRERKVE